MSFKRISNPLLSSVLVLGVVISNIDTLLVTSIQATTEDSIVQTISDPSGEVSDEDTVKYGTSTQPLTTIDELQNVLGAKLISNTETDPVLQLQNNVNLSQTLYFGPTDNEQSKVTIDLCGYNIYTVTITSDNKDNNLAGIVFSNAANITITDSTFTSIQKSIYGATNSGNAPTILVGNNKSENEHPSLTIEKVDVSNSSSSLDSSSGGPAVRANPGATLTLQNKAQFNSHPQSDTISTIR